MRDQRAMGIYPDSLASRTAQINTTLRQRIDPLRAALKQLYISTANTRIQTTYSITLRNTGSVYVTPDPPAHAHQSLYANVLEGTHQQQKWPYHTWPYPARIHMAHQ